MAQPRWNSDKWDMPEERTFYGRVGKYDVWLTQAGLTLVWWDRTRREAVGTVHSWRSWTDGRFAYWPENAKAKISAMMGMLYARHL